MGRGVGEAGSFLAEKAGEGDAYRKDLIRASNELLSAGQQEAQQMALSGMTVEETQIVVSFSESRRSIWNELLWSGVFGVLSNTAKANRPVYQKALVPTTNSQITMYYTGEALDGDDLDVLCGALFEVYKARGGDLVNPQHNQPIEVSATDLLNAIKWPRTGHYYDRLAESLVRLREGMLWIESNGRSGRTLIGCNFISDLSICRAVAGKNRIGSGVVEPAAAPDGDTGGSLVKNISGRMRAYETQIRLSIPPAFLMMYRDDMYTWLDVGVRSKLGLLGRWLYGWICSHREPMPISLQKIREVSRSTNSRESNFRYKVMRELTILQDEGVISSFRITEHGMVHVTRSTRHAKKREAPPSI